MKDEYISTEHFLLALAGGKTAPATRCGDRGRTKDAILAALVEVRGNQRVTDDDPEAKYEALDRYCRDLTRLAHQGKLDPVIGRDEEIRRDDPDPVPPHEEQSGARRRGRRRQDRRRRGHRAAHRARRCARVAARQAAPVARPRRADRRREISRRVRGAAEGRAQGDRGRRGRGSSCSSTSCTRSSARAPPKARRTRRTCSSRHSRAASCAASARRSGWQPREPRWVRGAPRPDPSAIASAKSAGEGEPADQDERAAGWRSGRVVLLVGHDVLLDPRRHAGETRVGNVVRADRVGSVQPVDRILSGRDAHSPAPFHSAPWVPFTSVDVRLGSGYFRSSSVDLSGEGVGEARAGSMEADGNRVRRDPEDRRDLLVAELLPGDEAEDLLVGG